MSLITENLNVFIAEKKNLSRQILKDINLNIEKGQSIGIFGRSGEGKTTLAKAIAGILDLSRYQVRGKIFNPATLSESTNDPKQIRGDSISYIYQESMSSLNPLMTVGEQIRKLCFDRAVKTYDPQKSNLNKGGPERLQEAVDLFKQFGFSDIDNIFGLFPHQLSGGMRQRIIIIQAITKESELLVADECLSAIDESNRKKIKDAILKMVRTHKKRVIWILHNPFLLMEFCDHIYELDEGILKRFDPNLVEKMKLFMFSEKFKKNVDADVTSLGANPSLLKVTNAQKTKNGKFPKISLNLGEGEAIGICGESGAGKSTFGKCVVGLAELESGTISYKNKEVDYTNEKVISQLRKDIQFVFQDPISCLNPSRTVRQAFADVTALFKGEKNKEVEFWMNELGLDSALLERYPGQLSGGERQRVAFARVLLSRPQTIILDEPVANLDFKNQIKIYSILEKLKNEFGMSFILISHDFSVLGNLCSRIYDFSRMDAND